MNCDDDVKPQDTRYFVVSLWNTLQSKAGGIFSIFAEGSDASIQSTVRDVEFVGGFKRVSPSESYLFLNAKTGSERKVLVLWMNSSKGKKREIIKSLQAATIRCCSDKARPVLVACTVIPSVNSVIWAGVFSAQNQQDPENSALALYDIRSIQGRVKGFCASGENPCGSESDTELQPLSVVFKHSSMSAVAAVRSGSWIVLFMGTSDSQLIKFVLDEKFTPGCPTVLLKSDGERAVLPRMHFDPVDFKHIYIALRKEVRFKTVQLIKKVSVVSCVKYGTLIDCRAALDPLCGWCVNIQRCSTQECLKSSWVSTPKDSLQKQLVSFQVWAEKSSSKITLYLSLSLESTGNPAFSCTFPTGAMNLCDGSDPPAVFPNCYCRFSGLNVSAEVAVGDQKITEMLMLKDCLNIKDNSPSASYTQCVQCVSSGCHWSSSSKCCEWAHGRGPQLHVQVRQCVSYITLILSPAALEYSPHGGKKIHVQGSNLEFVESVTVHSSYKHYDLKTQQHKLRGKIVSLSRDVWFESPHYDGSDQFSLLLNAGNSTVDCENLSFKPDPGFTGFTTVQVANDLQVNIKKKADMLNLSMSEVTVTGLQGDQEYPCLLEKIESNAVICKIKGESGAVPAVDSLTIMGSRIS
ncbi:uncharacterized protein [Sinocyclocheilus grahami]|uniref:uncharacterized protein n=1 Tax=Sinocyclocheilus grahami TaxID=75366 RepID=UPI0007AD5ADC|nr:PREDICTED: uncharacterized protein LOC107553870 [Sinocyclocheilus grahami]